MISPTAETIGTNVYALAVSGVAAAAHGNARSKAVLAVGGALSGLTAVAAVFLGLLLGTGR